ncbi:MAG: PspC protein, partial [Friedmanniella sp.]|nr:PspC protein [Friedmanniella sp.]
SWSPDGPASPTFAPPAFPPPAALPPPAPVRLSEPEPGAPRRMTRIREGSVLGGVCTGLAQHLGWPLMVVRIAFVVLAITQFVGVIAYGLCWLLMPPAPDTTAPGLESASRAGLRSPTRPARRVDWGMLLALAALGTGLLWIVQSVGLGISGHLLWPVVFGCAGAALVWRQADSADPLDPIADTGGSRWLAPVLARGGGGAVVRIVVGLALVGAAFGMVLAQWGQLQQLPRVLAMTSLALAGLAVLGAPWLHRSRRALNQARADKVRADARADMAAHLHDSVLQTLALIQRQSEDPRAVQQLARRQERELRSWLYADEVPEATLKAALTAAAAEVEDDQGVPVELVMVGDAETSDRGQALVRAAREAMVNAAKHAGADKIDVYAEVGEDLVEVFVRDRGRGFDTATIGVDRMGVKGSIIDRMARHGGRAVIRSRIGDGTEVRLEIPR